PAPITTIAKPAQTQMYEMMIAGVISFGPSHETPPYGAAKVDLSTPARRPEPFTSSKVNVPSSSAVVVCTFFPDESNRSTVTPGNPSSPFSTFPAVPPPGEKSRQTTPVIAPCFDCGAAAC